MKKILLTLFTVAILTGASAQINPGTFMLGGSSDLRHISTNPDRGPSYNYFAFDAKAGYFVIENLALGLNLGYGKDSRSNHPNSVFGIFGRYYVQGKFILGTGVNSVRAGSRTGTSLFIEGGYAAFVTNFLAIEPTLTYAIYGGDLDYTTLGVNVGLTLYFNRR